MNFYDTKLRSHFSALYSSKDYIKFRFSPRPYTLPVFEISLYTPSFIENDYFYNRFSDSLNNEKYPGRLIQSISNHFLIADPSLFTSVTSIEVISNLFDDILYRQFISDFDNVIEDYEKYFVLKQIFSS